MSKTYVNAFTATPGDNTGPDVVDLEETPQYTSATLTVRAKTGQIGSVVAAIQQKSWDDPLWTDVASVSVYADDVDGKTVTAELDPSRELVRWRVNSPGVGIPETYVRFTVDVESQ